MPVKHTYAIDSHLPQIVEFLKSNTLTLVEAAPGTGKTTRVPFTVLNAGYEQIYVLEPRRLAARLASHYVAEFFGEQPGGTVGYQIRFEEVGGRATKIWYLTEGVLTRKLLAGSRLPGVQVVILDEFHERHLETDLALALLLRLQKQRSDLKIILMSATLSAHSIRPSLGNPPFVQSEGRQYPVQISFTPHTSNTLELQVARAVESALQKTTGHILVFLPGAAEIRQSMNSCEPLARSKGASVYPLHGDLSVEEQNRAVLPSSKRKVIFSTNVAESSVTIEGVAAVIDSGLARVLTYSAWTGLSQLKIEKVSQSSIVQRSGRAGRTGPGIAIRLFPESDFVRRPAQIPPEILRAEFSSTLLQLAANGLDWNDLQWLDAPNIEHVRQARELLLLLGALDERGRLSAVGRQMARLPVHPRLARFLVAAANFGAGEEAADLAAKLAESARADSGGIDELLARDPSYSVKRVRRQILQSLPDSDAIRIASENALERALLHGFADRVARLRADHLLLANGRMAKLNRGMHARGDFILALDIDDRGDQAPPLVRLAADVEPNWLLEYFPQEIEISEELVWNREAERVEQVSFIRFRRLILDETRSAPVDRAAAARLLVEKALEAGVERLTDGETLARLQQRVDFAATHASFEAPADLLAASLQELSEGLVSFPELRTALHDGALIAAMQAKLPMGLIDEIAPSHIRLPSGRRAPIEYHADQPPSVASRLQDFFGLKSSPTIAAGKIALVLQLLAPNMRPVQVTTDLASFWKNHYPPLRRELSRRYPRHSWPENPD